MKRLARSARVRRALLLLALLVGLVHMMVVSTFAERLQAFADRRGGKDIAPMEVAFVRELKPQEPPEPPQAALAPAPAAQPPSRAPTRLHNRAQPPAQAASAPARTAKAPRRNPPPPRADPQPESPADDANPIDTTVAAAPAASAPTADVAASAPPPPDDSAEAVAAAAASQAASSPTLAQDARDAAPRSAGASGASRATGASAATGSQPGFEWPPSTQLRYALTGYYRGPVEGTARVQWVRKDQRYQVRLSVAVGPEFAPLMSRLMVSEGDLGPQGLQPRRYQERTRIGFSVRELALQFDEGRAVLANGAVVAVPSGMQDASSQFVQLSYLFTLNPSLLVPGRSLSFPVALPRRVDSWTYDVVATEVLDTPIGALETFHLRPRRDSPRVGELVAQAWFAPALQYLPVRILIHQDAESFIDLKLDSPPLQAEPEPR